PYYSRIQPSAVWAGDRFILWGGLLCKDGVEPCNDGLSYDPAKDGWQPIALNGAPAARGQHTTVWTGSRMVIWGGAFGRNAFADGAVYDPTQDAWAPMKEAGLAPRALHSAVWTGTRMIVWGGGTYGSASNDGAAYDPSANVWSSIRTEGAPS